MVARQGSPESLGESYTSRRIDRLTRLVARGRAGRDTENVALADLVDRARGLGCPSGDMRLAYGWRTTVIRVVLVAVVVGLGSRVALTGLFVEFVTDGVVTVAGFNAAVTVLATLTLGLAHARGVPFVGSHRLVSGRRSISHGDARWRRALRQPWRQRADQLASWCRRGLEGWSRWSHTLVWKRRHGWARLVARCRRLLSRWLRQGRMQFRARRRRRDRAPRPRWGASSPRLRGLIRRRRRPVGRRRVATLVLCLGR